MRNRFFLLCILAALVVSCAKDQQEVIQIITDAPVFYAAIEEAGNPVTRVFADSQLRVLWNADDRVSIFNKKTYNQQYRFDGQDGDNSGAFKVVPNDDSVTSNSLDYVYSVYPYNENTNISNDGEITVCLPTEQSYRENSFGLGANTMIAITQGDELMFKNLCGYFAIKLYGDNISVSSITLKGNNNEPLAGKATVVAQNNAAPSVQMDPAEATKELTLSCATPVTLGTSAETATTFWFVVPPTSFTNGFTLTVTDIDNGFFVKTTSGSLEIKRNTLKKSAALKVEIEGLTPPEPSSAIQFVDPIAKYACLEMFDTNSDGEVSYAEAAAATSLEGLFINWNTVESFDEIQYFTGVTSTKNVFEECSRLTHITIPDWITTLGTFQNCSSLKTVVLPASLSSIPESCFDGCSVLTNITLPIAITSIPNHCFNCCTSLSTIVIPNNVTAIGLGAFSGCTNLAAINFPAALLSIESMAFSNCTSLISATLGDNLTLGQQVFSGCTSLTTVVLPKYLSELPHSCFSGCTALTSVSWPIALTTIGPYAFSGCTFSDACYSIELPSTVTSISNNAFGYLRHLVLPSSSPISIESNSFLLGYTLLYVPANMVESYMVRSNWSKYKGRIKPIEDYPAELTVEGAVGEAIDLGLSVKWASWNIGAYSPEDYGGYFAWGETSVKWDYNETNNKWADYVNYNTILLKYNTNSHWGTVDNKTTLDLEDDAAHVNWGGTWRMPTKTEMDELLNNCTYESCTVNGVYGYRFTSKKEGYTNNSIFFPAAGKIHHSFYNAGAKCYYWTSTLDDDFPEGAIYMVSFGNRGSTDENGNRRFDGLTIRPVCPNE